MFDNYYQLRRESHPDEATYITLLFCIQGSGADREEVRDIFETYMIEGDDYDEDEFKGMVDYLYKVANQE